LKKSLREITRERAGAIIGILQGESSRVKLIKDRLYLSVLRALKPRGTKKHRDFQGRTSRRGENISRRGGGGQKKPSRKGGGGGSAREACSSQGGILIRGCLRNPFHPKRVGMKAWRKGKPRSPRVEDAATIRSSKRMGDTVLPPKRLDPRFVKRPKTEIVAEKFPSNWEG